MDLFLPVVFLMMLMPSISQSALEAKRRAAIVKLEKLRQSRVIVLIHRQEVMNLLGFPIARYINIEDSEQILRAIHLTPADMPLDIVLHTPGGLVLASQQIAVALTRHQAKVTVFVPHYAMSGGTLLALASDEIVMDENAVLGPVDPQLGNQSAAGILKLVADKPVAKLDDQTLILADIAEKALKQVESLVNKILSDHIPQVKVDPERIPEIARNLASGIWTHDYPITVEDAQRLGLPVKTGLPSEVYELMDLYPQSANTRSTVQFVPMPYGDKAQNPAQG